MGIQIGFKCTNLEEVINDFLKKTDEMYETTFLQDEDFKKMLLIHVTLLIDRLHDKISYKNELANELSITNSVVFNIAIQFCDMLQELYDVKQPLMKSGLSLCILQDIWKRKNNKNYNFMIVLVWSVPLEEAVLI
ncbi:MAG: PRD domain-containing protein [Catenibacterium mitsuokai]|nr:PRD domain-containing protein [Catenibacterium mitsuokai]MEE0081183.1 PRD domain-containing protein [Catenibacterium mitsuokai]